MANVLSALLVFFAGLIAIPVFVFFLEIIGAIFAPDRDFLLRSQKRQRIAVLVPAHNESSALLGTLEDIKAQLQAGDRLLVVADNCTDDTAAVAAMAGAEVTERHDPAKIGKGYALAWGIHHLSIDPPGIVIIVDADCRLASETISWLAEACTATNQPIQALYLMTAPDHSSIDHRVAMFAFRVKNWVRPLGLRAFNLPCQLMGTGMAVPWATINSVDLATGAIVEDLKLGLELAQTGHPPLFCPSARVDSHFPSSIKGAKSQRKRWEQGHLGMIATTIPRLVYVSLSHRNFRLLALTLDMAIPPLTLLGMLLTLALLMSGFGVLFGVSDTAFIINAISVSAFVLALVLCWLKFGRDLLPLSSLFSVISYATGKLLLYRQIFLAGNASQWIRTDREKITDDGK
jgi:cellulose synthase/poly-beta-1,6-N-acetylglucosamine synthase-like glycosyltransferase